MPGCRSRTTTYLANLEISDRRGEKSLQANAWSKKPLRLQETGKWHKIQHRSLQLRKEVPSCKLRPPHELTNGIYINRNTHTHTHTWNLLLTSSVENERQSAPRLCVCVCMSVCVCVCLWKNRGPNQAILHCQSSEEMWMVAGWEINTIEMQVRD